MEKKSLREVYIDSIMSDKYGDDDPKYDDRNRAFLESLSIEELANMSDEPDDDDEVYDNE